MPGDEQKSKNKAERHATCRLAIIPSSMSIQTTVTYELQRGEGYQNISLVLAIVTITSLRKIKMIEPCRENPGVLNEKKKG